MKSGKQETVPIASSSDVVLARQKVRQWALEMKFTLVDQTKLVTAASELARNALEHGKGGQMVRSAGGVAQLVAKEGDYAQVKLPSGEVRKVHVECSATIGQLGNIDHKNVSYGKAGRTRWLGKRPHNRGVSMNPVDHPHGGGEGKTSGGRHPVTPWGKPTKGYKTRSNKRTDKFIARSRHARKGN